MYTNVNYVYIVLLFVILGTLNFYVNCSLNSDDTLLVCSATAANRDVNMLRCRCGSANR